jgi:hypothetical protein
MATKADFIFNERVVISDLIAVLDRAAALQRQYTAQNFGHTSLGIVDGDFVSGNAGMLATEFKAAVTALAEFNNAFTSGGTIAALNDKKLYLVKL